MLNDIKREEDKIIACLKGIVDSNFLKKTT